MCASTPAARVPQKHNFFPSATAVLYSKPDFCLTESMKRSEAARYARLSAVLALLLISVTGTVYLRRIWGEYRDRKSAPAPAPENVDRQSSGLTFSKVDGERTIFTVQASKSINFKGKDDSRLEDVRITIFGKTGERHDVLHTQSCQYSKETISCSGLVQIEMQSAVDAARGAKPLMTVETRGVSFDRTGGLAETAQRVKFSFPEGSGEAIGVQYRSEQGTLRLMKDIRLNVAQGSANVGSGKGRGSSEVHIVGSSLLFDRDARTMALAGPAQAETETQKLTGGEMLLTLSESFHAQELVVTAGAGKSEPQLTSKTGGGGAGLVADKMTAVFAQVGWVARMDAAGSVKGKMQRAAETDDFSAENASMEMWPRVNEPKTLELKGNVSIKTGTTPSVADRTLQTSGLRVQFSEGKAGGAGHPVRAETLSTGTIDWLEEPLGPNGLRAHTKLQGDTLQVNFGPDGKAGELRAVGNVITERAVEGKPVQSAKASDGTAQLAAGGGWTQIELRGSVKLAEGEKSAQAERAVFLRAAQSVTLTGNAVVSDGTRETHAQQIIFLQSTGDVRAEGGVRSTDFSAKGNSSQLSAAPANLSADSMRANTKTMRAIYTGHARMWQGETVVEANTIELVKDRKEILATGNVRGIFPQTARKGIALWHVSAGTMTYSDADNRAHLEQNAEVRSADQRIRAQAIDLFFVRTAGGKNGSATQQISRAVGTGGVIVEQGGKRGTADRGEYIAAEGKFVLSGGTPTLFDAQNGTTTGRELTFFFADDTIIVDSENGSRTVTKHRVER